MAYAMSFGIGVSVGASVGIGVGVGAGVPLVEGGFGTKGESHAWIGGKKTTSVPTSFPTSTTVLTEQKQESDAGIPSFEVKSKSTQNVASISPATSLLKVSLLLIIFSVSISSCLVS